MLLLMPLIKADAMMRRIVATLGETPDRLGEVMDYASSKPHFQAWSDEMAKASGGQSLGNIRAQHGRVAAGKVVDIAYDDTAKTITITADIVDDDEWKKVEAGVYTGISPGGKYLKRWPDGRHTRYTARPIEVSLVDRPCIPDAGLTMVKADGTVEHISPADLLAKAGARHSAADKERLQAIHDHAVGMGAECPGCPGGPGDLQKTDASGHLAKMEGALESLTARLAKVEAQPLPGGPARIDPRQAHDDLNKSDGGGDLDRITALPPGPEKAKALIRFAQQHRQETF